MIVSSKISSARRFRFALRTLLFAISLVAIVIALVLAYRQSHENELLRQENARLRGQVGQLKIGPGTEDRLQVLAVPTVEDMTWKWRVHVPNRQGFHLKSKAGNDIPGDGFPEQTDGDDLKPGEHLITVVFRRNVKGAWEWFVDDKDWASSSILLSDKQAQAIIERHTVYPRCAGEGSISSADPGKPLLLLRYRVFSTPPSQQVQDDPTNGILVWICEGIPQK